METQVHADAVYIMDNSKDALHFAELSLKALKHVFIAKPDILDLEQMQYLKKLAQESGVVLQLGTGYKFCSAYATLSELSCAAKVINVMYQLTNSCNMKLELFYIFDFVTNILNNNIIKFDFCSWKNAENLYNLFHYRIDCDNGSVVNITFYKIAEGEPKLEITFASSETLICADVFKSVIKQYRAGAASEITLDDYCEKSIRDCYIQNFRRAINNESDAVRTIDKQFQNLISSLRL